MVRRTFIERTLRQIYNGQPSDDSNITVGLVNSWLGDAIASAAKQNLMDNMKVDGVAYVNNSFHTTYKGIAITEDERGLYKFQLPQIPLGIGATEGVSRIVFKDAKNTVSYPAIMLSEAQVGMQRSMRPVQNKLVCYPEGGYCFIPTPIIMTEYTASCTLISGGDASDLDSELNVPQDYFGVMVAYIQQQLMIEKKQPQDLTVDGRDN